VLTPASLIKLACTWRITSEKLDAGLMTGQPARRVSNP